MTFPKCSLLPESITQFTGETAEDFIKFEELKKKMPPSSKVELLKYLIYNEGQFSFMMPIIKTVPYTVSLLQSLIVFEN